MNNFIIAAQHCTDTEQKQILLLKSFYYEYRNGNVQSKTYDEANLINIIIHFIEGGDYKTVLQYVDIKEDTYDRI